MADALSYICGDTVQQCDKKIQMLEKSPYELQSLQFIGYEDDDYFNSDF